MRKLGPDDYRTMPWKNGLGFTTELLIDPPGATLEAGFRWRISTAAVAQSGPFSSFPGFDRTLMLLEGDGLELDHGPHGRATLPGPLVPVRFKGEWETRGRLLGGACRDFNVMSRRAEARHDLTLLRAGPDPAPLPEAPVLLLYCCAGAAKLDGMGKLARGELLKIDGGGGRVRGADGPCDLAVIAIW
jgi:environmental stress-induced protein Ves